MKKNFLLLVMCLLVGVVFVACESDEDSVPTGPLAKIEIKQLLGTKDDTAFVLLNLYLRRDLRSEIDRAFTAAFFEEETPLLYDPSIGFLVGTTPLLSAENAWVMKTNPVFFGAAPLNTILKAMHAQMEQDPLGPENVATVEALLDYANTIIVESDGSNTYPVAIWGLEPNTKYYIVPFFKSDTTGVVTGTLPCFVTTTQN